jgi:hypothetical protein
MNLAELKEMAKNKGIKVGKSNKSDIIRAIQNAEGNFPCFATGQAGECGQGDCLWRKECN